MSRFSFTATGCGATFMGGMLLLVSFASPARAAEPSASRDQEVIAKINKFVLKGWSDNGITPSATATDSEWVRRVFLDVFGRIPTVEESKKFTSDKAADKKRTLVTSMLYSEEYVEEYARNFTTIWTNILIGRTGGTGRRSLVNREGLQQYVRRSFLRHKPYDQMAYELVSAEGSNKPGEDDYNGAVNFILDDLGEKAANATAKVARIFLGLQVQCTQCHNHPFNNWKQDSFWGMNAFFRQAQSLRTRQGRTIVSVRLVDGDFAGEGSPPTPEEAEIYWEQRNGLLKASYPTFVDGTRINPSGYVEDVRRRDELAKLIRKSPQLPKAFVNRMWSHFFGYGFTKPIDDMGPHNSPSHPELLDDLAKEFAKPQYPSKRGFDIRKLIVWMTLSEPYSLSSRFGRTNGKDDPDSGEQPLFSHFYLRQMTAEQLYESLIIATDAHKSRGTYKEQEKLKSTWLKQFAVAFGTDENDETTTFNGTIPQTLMMWNGDLIKKAVSGGKGSLLWRVASDSKIKDKTGYLYLAALGRKPTATEKLLAKKAWKAHGGNTMAALQDVFWVVLNSNEFILQH